MTKQSISRLLQASLMCCLAVLFTACDDIFASEDNPTPAYLQLSEAPVTIKVGDTYRRKAISVTTAVVEYTSSDTNVATVDGEGVVTAIAEGTATITATATGYSTGGKKIFQADSKSYKVTVAKKVSLVASITLNETKLIKKFGDAAVTLTATVAPDDATDKTVAWTSSNESVATVTDGVVNFIAAGTATITATATNGTEDTADDQTATCNVTVSFDLSTLTAAYPAHDGEVLTGETTNPVSIPDGATVYLADATINNTVECLGNATIVLNKETVNTISAATTAIKAGPTGTTLTLSGEGTLNATSSNNFNACIGSQRQGAAGNIVIEGGIINATSGNWTAAIGVGGGGTCENITINGGTVNAYGGQYGAGIGTGNNHYGVTSCGNITITGGIVKAHGGAAGAGIGTGGVASDVNYALKCGNITISGGTVDAYGGSYGAGIGAGLNYSSESSYPKCAAITISGGTVNAYGGQYAAGIGTSIKWSSDYPSPTCGSITISGGTITATKGSYATWDIGPGVNSSYSGYFDGIVSGTMSVTVTVKDKNGNDASIYGVAP